ncbi:uncharacterized protein N7529_003046 [Penicillium soppii]|uniref:uncharacterized protein n=1 Tax=Penicillium soppii TaxID=69789 RepID=UPI0025490A48|nr:uncharacterized protein N7529_003046 [Penicillium soppii]KAJ5874616.1 hypothetical protein N7529_003046 [Penicillium soppii]
MSLQGLNFERLGAHMNVAEQSSVRGIFGRIGVRTEPENEIAAVQDLHLSAVIRQDLVRTGVFLH